SLEQASNVAFLPAYPLAIKAFTLLTGNTWTAGILVSNLAFLAALIVLFKLTQLKFDRAVAVRAVLYTAAFPSAFFYFGMYGESLYLLAVLLSFYFWEKRRDWSGGIAGAVAALTRPMGMMLLMSGAAFHLVERGRRVGGGHTAQLIVHGVRSRLSWSVLSLLFIPLALAGFMAYTYAVFGEPLAFLKSRTVGWAEPVSILPTSHVELVASILNGGIFRGQGPALRLLDGASAVAFLALTGTVFKRLGPSYGLYSLGSLAMALVVNLDGLTRYVAVIFPVFMALASWRQRAVVAVPLVTLSLMLMGLMASMFAKWYFVG
ncbi:MAG: glycosyltransferase family 39 protein, partial [Dehalococcoidia bacterium]|nr:glycosyltransferase family 39 protein [Dehalococcoidia bacterium]